MIKSATSDHETARVSYQGDPIPLFEPAPTVVDPQVAMGKLHLVVRQSEEEFLASLKDLPKDAHRLHQLMLRSRQSEEENIYDRICCYRKLVLSGRPFWKDLRCSCENLWDYQHRFCKVKSPTELVELELLVQWFVRPTFVLLGSDVLRDLVHRVEEIHPGRRNEQHQRRAIQEIFDRYERRLPKFSYLDFLTVVKEYRDEKLPKPTVATPTITPNGGTFTGEVAITLQCATEGAQIRYTTDGGDPGASSLLYRGPFTLKANATVKARAGKGDLKDSGLASAMFRVVAPPPPPKPKATSGRKPQVATPTITPSGGSYVGEVAVTLQTTTDRAQIHYTTDGSDPSSSSPRYRSPFTLKATATVKARACNDGMKDSGVASEQFAVVLVDLHRRRQIFKKRLAKSGDIGRMLVEVTRAYQQYLYRHQQVIRTSNAARLLPQLQEECPDPITTFWQLMDDQRADV